MDGFSQFFSEFVTISTSIGNVASILSFLTILATAIGFLISHVVKDPFGEKAPKGPRYQRFFESMAARVHRLDKDLTTADNIEPSNQCAFSDVNQAITYDVHFIGANAKDHKRELSISLLLGPGNGQAATYASQHTNDFVDVFRKRCRDKTAALMVQEVGAGSVQVTLYYPNKVVIDDDAKKLKHVRKWAVQRIVALKATVEYAAHPPLVKKGNAQLAAAQAAG